MSDGTEKNTGDLPDEQRLAAAYENLADRVRGSFDAASEKTEAWLERALEQGRNGLQEAGEVTADEARKLTAYLRRDLQQLGTELQQFGEDTRRRFQQSPVRTGFLDLAANLLSGASETLERLAGQAEEALEVRTGEITGPGTLVCEKCGEELHYERAGRVPPCPGCRGTSFRKTYQPRSS